MRAARSSPADPLEGQAIPDPAGPREMKLLDQTVFRYEAALFWIEFHDDPNARFNQTRKYNDKSDSLRFDDWTEADKFVVSNYEAGGPNKAAVKSIIHALREGAVVATGRRGGLGARENIPAIDWYDLGIEYYWEQPDLGFGPHAIRPDWQDGAPIGHHYRDILFDAESVRRAFPIADTPLRLSAPRAHSRWPNKQSFVCDPEIENEALKNLTAAGVKKPNVRELNEEIARLGAIHGLGELNCGTVATYRRADRRAKREG